MSTLRSMNPWGAAGVGSAISLALFGGILALQSVRHAWPFVDEGTPRSGDAPADMPDMPDTPNLPDTPDMPAGAHGTHPPSGPSSGPQGYSAVTIDPERAGALELGTARVEERNFTKSLRTVGVVVLDETRTVHVHSKVRGWIDGIHVDYIGRRVKAGEPLCSIYSQEVYSAEIEFLSILDRGLDRTANRASIPGQPAGVDRLLIAARQRLASWDVPRAEIARLESSRQARRTFALLAPRSGVVLSKQAIQGMYVDPSVELYTLSDLSHVWVVADVYESDVAYMNTGDHARLTIEGKPAPLDGKVSFLSPTIDETTRTLKIRFDVDNPDGNVRPGAYATVEMGLAIGRGLSIPEGAVIRTGARSIVFVVHGEAELHFEPREVTLGPLIGGVYRVDAGLSADERVSVGAQFLLDSESRLRASSGPGGGHAH